MAARISVTALRMLAIIGSGGPQEALVPFMESHGFRTLHRSSGYSNHRHPDRLRGRVDFMYVEGRTSELLFGTIRQVPGPGGLSIAVPRPEHLIAMKVQAMKDAPERTWQDLADIGYLLRLPGSIAWRRRDTSRVLVWSRSGVSSPTAGGQSGDPESPHFADQAERYAKGELRDVYFYRDQLEGHTTREYRPGQ